MSFQGLGKNLLLWLVLLSLFAALASGLVLFASAHAQSNAALDAVFVASVIGFLVSIVCTLVRRARASLRDDPSEASGNGPHDDAGAGPRGTGQPVRAPARRAPTDRKPRP